MKKTDLLRLPRSLLQLLARISFRVRSGRVLLELVSIQVVLALIVPIFLPTLLESSSILHLGRIPNLRERVLTISSISFFLFALLYGGCSVLWVVLRWRLRPPGRSRLKQIVLECGMTILLGSELALSMALLMWGLGTIVPYTFLHPPVSLPETAQLSGLDLALARGSLSRAYLYVFAVAVAGWTSCFFSMRFAVHLLAFWNRLRRRQLRWALTHAHLMILIWGSLVVYVLAALLAIIGYRGDRESTAIDMFLAYIVLTGLVILFLTVIGIVFVLPPSALFSYLFSRRLVGRIEGLANATGALRSGRYDVRVKVDGEDEVAHLQSDFNAMADDLERTLHELQGERDNVSALLQARRELIASVSHELRTPVATVRSYLESTLTGWRDGPPSTLRQDLQIMEQQVIRLQSLINDLFTLARSEVGRLEMRSLPVNVELLVQRVVDTMAPVVWRSSRIEVVADIAPVAPTFPRVLADENRLEQILQNLLHNAVRHTAPGGIIVLGVRADEQSVILQVKDTGEGIAPEELEHIWKRFYRAENARNQSGSGSGLGLAIVRDLTEAMGGTVAAASTVGQGSIFTICLPRLGTGALLEHTADQFPSSATVRTGANNVQTTSLASLKRPEI